MNEPSFACSLTDERLRVRLEEWLALDERALLRAENRPNGRVHVYRAGEETERVLADLIEAEAGAARSWNSQFTERRTRSGS